MAENLTKEECSLLQEADNTLLSSYAADHTPLTKTELKELRRYDFAGILQAALLYLLVLLAGFVLNTVDTWMLQKMGQEIIYQM